MLLRTIFFVIVLAVAGALISCEDSNPASPPATVSYAGHWTGLTERTKIGVYFSDTFQIDLNMTGTTYTMARYNIFFESAGFMVDSAEESGTYAVSGNTITLNPTHWKQWDWETGIIKDTVYADEDPNPNRTPKVLAIPTSASSWTFALPEWKNGDTITYNLNLNLY